VLTSADVTVGESSITLPSESVAVVRVAG
jgi:hypothetical protein